MRAALLLFLPFLMCSQAGASLVIASIDFDTTGATLSGLRSGTSNVFPTFNLNAVGTPGNGGLIGIGGTNTSGGSITGEIASPLFDFTSIPGVTLGNLTVNDFDQLQFKFDANVLGSTQLSSLSLVSGVPGLFNGEISLGVNTAMNAFAGQGFRSYTVDFVNLDSGQKNNFVDLTNGIGTRAPRTTDFFFRFNFAQRNGQFNVGDAVVFDNLLVSATAVPEPSSVGASLFVVIGFAGLHYWRRRQTSSFACLA